MAADPKPPDTYQEFISKYPQLGKAWEQIAEAGMQGPLDRKTARLVKLAVAVGALREGAVHASVRKALSLGIKKEEIEQVIALAAGTLGLPAAVAVWSWAREGL